MNIRQSIKGSIAIALGLTLPTLQAKKPGKAPAPTRQALQSQAQQELKESLHPKPGQSKGQQGKIEQAEGWQDTLHRLIHDLDSGSAARAGQAERASTQIKDLGLLMVPALVKELDSLGPFGLSNVGDLLFDLFENNDQGESFPDAAFLPLTLRFLQDLSSARREFAARLFPLFSPQAQERLLTVFLNSKHRGGWLQALPSILQLNLSPEEKFKAVMRVFQQVNREGKGKILEQFEEAPPLPRDLEKTLIQEALKYPDSRIRRAALDLFVSHAKESEENQAFALFQQLANQDKKVLIRGVAKSHPNWSKLLLYGLDFPSTRKVALKALDSHRTPIPSQSIHRLLESEEPDLLPSLFQRLKEKNDLSPFAKTLLALLDSPHPKVQKQTIDFLFEKSPSILVQYPKFPQLDDKLLPFPQKISILNRVRMDPQVAGGGSVVRQALALWKEMEKIEARNPDASFEDEKSLLAEALADWVRPKDWPLLKTFLLTPYEDPDRSIPGKNRYTRFQLTEEVLPRFLVTPEIEMETLSMLPRLHPDLRENILLAIQNAEEPKDPSDPDSIKLREAAMDLVEKLVSQKGSNHVQSGILGDPAELAQEIGDDLLSQLPGSGRSQRVWNWLHSPKKELVRIGCKILSLSTIGHPKERRRFFQTLLQSPVLFRTWIPRELTSPLLAQDPSLREQVLKQLHGDILSSLGTGTLSTFLKRLDPSTRQTWIRQILQREKRFLHSSQVLLLLTALGEFRSSENLPVFQSFLPSGKKEIRLKALQAITDTYSPQAVAILIEALKEPRLKAAAKKGLETIDEYMKAKEKWEKRFALSSNPKKDRQKD